MNEWNFLIYRGQRTSTEFRCVVKCDVVKLQRNCANGRSRSLNCPVSLINWISSYRNITLQIGAGIFTKEGATINFKSACFFPVCVLAGYNGGRGYLIWMMTRVADIKTDGAGCRPTLWSAAGLFVPHKQTSASFKTECNLSAEFLHLFRNTTCTKPRKWVLVSSTVQSY